MDDARVLAFLQDLVRIDSTPGREERVVQRVAHEMRALGYDEVSVDASGNAVGRIGSGGRSLLVDCHVDTIPLHGAGEWTHPPFDAEVADGRLFGLGSSDMKASVAASVHGVARLKARGVALPGTVWVSCSIAEEMMEGAALADTVDRCEPDLVVIGEPTDLRLAVGQRGRAKLEVKVTGLSSHAGHPEVGLNAVERMAEYIGAAARLNHPVDSALGPRILTCIDIHSEPYPSVSTVPGTCVAHFDCRFGRGESEESLLHLMYGLGRIWDRLARRPRLECQVYRADFDTYNGRSYNVPEYAAAWYLEPGSPLVEAGLAGLEEAGIEPRISTYGFCTNGSLTALRGIPTLGFGIAREEEAHTVDEWVSVENLYRGTRGYTELISHLLTNDAAPIAGDS